MVEYYLGQTEHPTVAEIKERFKGVRGLKIETNDEGVVTDASYRVPCFVCGVYHHLNSKPAQRCAIKLMMAVRSSLDEAERWLNEFNEAHW